jgi:hypothetical protein
MFRTVALVVAALLIAAGCQKTTNAAHRGQTPVGQSADMRNRKAVTIIQPVPEGFLDRSAIGSELAADGTVKAQKESFVQGEPVYVTMRFNLSPAGLQSSLRVLDDKGKELHRDSKEMKGEKIVTFKVPPAVIAKPGSYQVEGFWGGNDACEYKLDVRGKKKS